MIKQKPPTQRELAMRQITCGYCGKKHFIKDGDCFNKNKRKNSER